MVVDPVSIGTVGLGAIEWFNASQGRLQYGCVYISYIVYAVRACHSDAFKSGPLVSLARDGDY